MSIWTVARFEFLRYFKWKQELIGIALMFVGIALTSLWPFIKNATDSDYKIAIVTTDTLPKVEGFQFTALPADATQTAMQGVGEVWDGVLVLEPEFTLTLEQQASWHARLQTALQQWRQQQLIAALPLTADQQAIIKKKPTLTLNYQKQPEQNRSDKATKLLSMMLLILLTLGVFSGFGLMFTGITSEKQHRVTEQLLTLITPHQWMDGKILGISLFCLKSMCTTGLLLFIFFQVMATFSDKTPPMVDISLFTIAVIVLYVLLGLLLVNSFMAGFAATIDDPNHSSRSIMMFLPSLPLALAFSVMENSEGLMMQILSLLPLTSFAAMPLRMANTDVPWYELMASILILLVFLWWLKAAAARIFLLGIRMYGKEPSWELLLKTFLFKGVA
jgi:ABC-2 type transport system permease protein